MRDLRTVKTGDLAAALRITAKQERERLRRVARSDPATVLEYGGLGETGVP